MTEVRRFGRLFVTAITDHPVAVATGERVTAGATTSVSDVAGVLYLFLMV
jgi:hypothetical protein